MRIHKNNLELLTQLLSAIELYFWVAECFLCVWRLQPQFRGSIHDQVCMSVGGKFNEWMFHEFQRKHHVCKNNCSLNYSSQVLPKFGLIHPPAPLIYVAGSRATFQHVRQTHPCHNTRSDLGSYWGCLGLGLLVNQGGEPPVIHQQLQDSLQSHGNWWSDVIYVKSSVPSIPTVCQANSPLFAGRKSVVCWFNHRTNSIAQLRTNQCCKKNTIFMCILVGQIQCLIE